MTGGEQDQQSGGRQAGPEIAEQHDPAPVVAIHEHPGHRAEHDLKDEGEKAQQRQRRGLAGLVIGPDDQGEAKPTDRPR